MLSPARDTTVTNLFFTPVSQPAMLLVGIFIVVVCCNYVCFDVLFVLESDDICIVEIRTCNCCFLGHVNFNFGGNRRRQLSGTSTQPFLVPLFLYRDWIDCFVCPLELRLRL